MDSLETEQIMNNNQRLPALVNTRCRDLCGRNDKNEGNSKPRTHKKPE